MVKILMVKIGMEPFDLEEKKEDDQNRNAQPSVRRDVPMSRSASRYRVPGRPASGSENKTSASAESSAESSCLDLSLKLAIAIITNRTLRSLSVLDAHGFQLPLVDVAQRYLLEVGGERCDTRSSTILDYYVEKSGKDLLHVIKLDIPRLVLQSHLISLREYVTVVLSIFLFDLRVAGTILFNAEDEVTSLLWCPWLALLRSFGCVLVSLNDFVRPGSDLRVLLRLPLVGTWGSIWFAGLTWLVVCIAKPHPLGIWISEVGILLCSTTLLSSELILYRASSCLFGDRSEIRIGRLS